MFCNKWICKETESTHLRKFLLVKVYNRFTYCGAYIIHTLLESSKPPLIKNRITWNRNGSGYFDKMGMKFPWYCSWNDRSWYLCRAGMSIINCSDALLSLKSSQIKFYLLSLFVPLIQVARRFHRHHSTIQQLIDKYRRTGSVMDIRRRPRRRVTSRKQERRIVVFCTYETGSTLQLLRLV